MGDDKPAYVRAEISVDLSNLAVDVWRAWEILRPDDVVLLLAVKGSDEAERGLAKRPNAVGTDRYGLRALRAAEVIQILDKNGRIIRQDGNWGSQSRQRRIHVRLDAAMYKVIDVIPAKISILLT